MKTTLLSLLCSGLLFLAGAAQAQTTTYEPVHYSEQVPADAGKTALYSRAADWVENHFAFGPKTDLRLNASTGEVRVTGTGKVKPVDTAGKDQPRTIRFEFVFRYTDDGYSYSIGSFRCIPDAKNPSESIPLDEYLMQLGLEKSNARTHNDRRVNAQSNAMASEIAMNFRSFMNQMPAVQEEGTVGLPAKEAQ